MSIRRITVGLVACLLLACFLFGQQVDDPVLLQSSNPQGVPVHPAAGDRSFVRWANGTTGIVRTMDPTTGWFEVESSNGSRGWITRQYITVIAPDEEPDDPDLGIEIPSYVIGSWNLEHFKDGAGRGFPENGFGGPSYGSRAEADFRNIARIITSDLSAKILILNEINGISGERRSTELDRLVGLLGDTWKYELTLSGGAQRVAILFDSASVRREACQEFVVAQERVNGSDIFARDPLACRFTFLEAGGQAKNDMLVVGLHLASGQDKVSNHNRAMEVLITRLRTALSDGTFPAGETDIFIGGDLNASRYDNRVENFWDSLDSAQLRFLTLSPEDGSDYPGTRLAGVPLFPRSQIDYLIASNLAGGLGADLVQLGGHVHAELVTDGFDDFRERVSDHLPVTVRVRLVHDDD